MKIQKLFSQSVKSQTFFNSSRKPEHNPFAAQVVAVGNRFKMHEEALATRADFHEQRLHRSEKPLITQALSIGTTLSQRATDLINRFNRLATRNQRQIPAPQMA